MRATIGSFAAAAAVIGTATASATAQQAVQWRVEDGGNGHWYIAQRWSTPKTWDEAKAIAEQRGGYLACVTSASENQLVYDHFDLNQPGCGNSQEGWHLGGYQDLSAKDYSEPAGGWRWISGEPWQFTAWLTDVPGGDRPNNFGPGGEQFLKMSEMPYAPRWDDVGVGSNQERMCGAIIEWSADCNGDGIVDYGQCRDGSLPDYNLNNIPDCCEAGTPCEVGNYPVQWRVADGGNGHWYHVRLAGAPTTWQQCLQLSQSAGGHLATLASSEEHEYASGYASAHPYAWSPGLGFGPVLGARQTLPAAEPSSNWYWVTGEAWDFTAWGFGEPNDHEYCGQGGDEPYLALFGSNSWNDVQDTIQCFYGWLVPSYLIEWSTDCNGDGIVDYGQILQGQLVDANNNGVPDSCEVDPCPADVTGNDLVDGVDLAAILGAWGTDGQNQYDCDIDNDGVVSGTDLAFVLGGWGPCQ